MFVLDEFILNLQDFLVADSTINHNIIRKHTKKLDQLGDVSFPLNLNNWCQLVDITIIQQDIQTIFEYKYPHVDKEAVGNELIKKSSEWTIRIKNVIFRNSDVYLFFHHDSLLYRRVIQDVLNLNDIYGSSDIIKSKVDLKLLQNVGQANPLDVDLSLLRLILMRNVSKNLINFATCKSAQEDCIIYLVPNIVNNGHTNVLCGPVLDEKSSKSSCTGEEIFQKRSSDMRMMAQHKYGVQVKSNTGWETYFEKLGSASVTIEMLTNKPQKAIKITPHNLQSANKGASFIFYNCARLAALFKEFDKMIETGVYPEFPDTDKIDFCVLNQPEEWELFYVYILQFPTVIKSCIKDIERGILNPQHLITFLYNLSSVFSVYYRRVRILTNPKEHLFSIIHARIYLLKALQCVFHNALRLLNIEPVKEM